MGASPPVNLAVESIRQHTPAQAFALYAELRTQSPDHAQLAALALRHMARAGDIEPRGIAVLDACLADAPDGACVLHLSKALAAFGRDAVSAAPTVADKIAGLHVTDDVAYWVFEGTVFALMFLGGPRALLTLDALAAQVPPRPLRAQSVYVGAMPRERREKRFEMMLTDGRAVLAQADPRWLKKRTRLQANAQPQAVAASKKAWSVR